MAVSRAGRRPHVAVVLAACVVALLVLGAGVWLVMRIVGSPAHRGDALMASWAEQAADPARGSVPVGTWTGPDTDPASGGAHATPAPPAGAPTADADRAARPGTAPAHVDEAAVYVAAGAEHGDGSPARPFGSVSDALDATRAGATIVLRAGIYHETVHIHDSPGTPRSGVTIEAYPGEEVWFDGSVPVEVEERDGRWVARWRDSPQWNDVQGFGDVDETGDLTVVGPQNPVAADATEVWVGGRRLWQVERDPGAGQFAVDRTGSAPLLILGEDPGDQPVRGARLAQAIVSSADDTTLRGFGVRGYATPVNWMGTVYLEGERPHVEHVVLSELPTIPLFLSGATDAVVEHVSVLDAGLQGISAVHSDGATFRANEIRRANSQRFNPAPIAGGMKVGQMAGFTIADTLVADTVGATGLWVDETGTDFSLIDNVVTGSGSNGIQVEISGRALVAGNVVLDSAGAGIQVYGSEQVTVANNLVAGSGATGGRATGNVVVVQDARRAADGGMGVDTRGADAGLTWVSADITVRGNILAVPQAQAAAQIDVHDRSGELTADQMGVTVTGNLLAGADDVPLLLWQRADGPVEATSTEDAAGALGARWSGNATTGADLDTRQVARAEETVAHPVGGTVGRALGVGPDSRLLGPTLTRGG